VVTDPGHAHSYSAANPVLNGPTGAGGPPEVSNSVGATTGSSTTGITVATTNTSTGGGLGHNNQPKTIVMNYIIKR
jgi:hypothetical protein